MRTVTWWLALVMLACGGGGGGGRDPAGPDEGGEAGPSCEPGRCLKDLARVIGAVRPRARACYDEGRKRQPELAGRLVINFAIDPAGAITEASQGMQDGQIEEPGVVECVVDVIKTVTFPPSPAGRTTRAYHQFEFTPDAR